jgi:hypothetical protein
MQLRLLPLIALAAAELVHVHAAQAAVVAGDLIRRADIDTVYYVSTDGKRYAFPHFNIYATWYLNFDRVETVSAEDMAAIPWGGVVYARPGTTMVKIQTDPKVYAVGAGGALRWIRTEALAASIYGADWNKHIVDLDPALFAQYRVRNDIDEDADYDTDFERHLAGEPSSILTRPDGDGVSSDPAASASPVPAELAMNNGFLLTVTAMNKATGGKLLMATNNMVFGRCENANVCRGVAGPYTVAGVRSIHTYVCDGYGNCKRRFIGNVSVTDSSAPPAFNAALTALAHADPLRRIISSTVTGGIPTEHGVMRDEGPTQFCGYETSCSLETPSLSGAQFTYRGFACDPAYRCIFSGPLPVGPLP